jgi:MOSC domain-containing protein YiiM
MRLESVQVGQVRTVRYAEDGRPLDRAFSSAIWKTPVAGPVWVGTEGVHGDAQHDRRHHGGPWRAVLMYPAEHYPRWQAEWGRAAVGPGGFGENLTVSGLDEWTVCLGDRLEIGEVEMEVSGPREPCDTLARRHGIRDLVRTVRRTHRYGWYLRVLRPGWLEAGQSVRLLARPYPQWPIARVAEIKWNRSQRPQEAGLLSECPALLPEWREALRRGTMVRTPEASG